MLTRTVCASSPAASADILLVAVNARYSHCAFAARSLLANLGALEPRADLLEADLDATPLQLAGAVAARRPRIVACSVYLWNTRLLRDTMQLLRRVLPSARIVLGGPEIVRGCAPAWRGLADALVRGEGEDALRALCARWLSEPTRPAPADASPEWIDVPGGVEPDTLVLPYARYTDADIRHRTLYVETTRGCPFHCLYCCSCGTGLRRLPLSRLLPELEALLARGARRFKFLDRSFNADEPHACRVLDFFLARPLSGLGLHLELTPTPLGEALRTRLAAFPRGVLHVEVGVQTLDPCVAHRIGRREPRKSVLETLSFLTERTGAAVHADLIFGLPGEDEATFGRGFDALVRLGVPELQVNRLKGLPGTPLLRLPELRDAFSPLPPYEVLRTDSLDFASLERLQRLAAAWERLHNRGRFRHALPLLWSAPGASPFTEIGALAEAAHAETGRLHALSLQTWARLLSRHLLTRGCPEPAVRAALARDGLAE